MKKTKTQKGITLIALIITIVVLLILAAVAISSIQNDNIIKYAQNAVKDYEQAQKDEQEMLDEYLSYMQGNGGGVSVEKAEVGTIVSINSTINGKKYTANNPVIPAGFMAINTETASWDAENGPQVDNGLVISDGTSEFVWIPVQNLDSFARPVAEGSEDYRGVLYDWTTTGYPEVAWSLDSTSYRESDVLEDYDGNYLSQMGVITDLNGDSNIDISDAKEQLQNEFNLMVESVKEYQGFYIGRYEMSLNENKTAQSKKSVIVSTSNDTDTQMWYGLYSKAKTYTNIKNSVQSSMIWGCQYDAMISWMGSEAHTSIGDSRNQTEYTGNVETDKLKNIYDLYGKTFDWTLEARHETVRVLRGGSYENDPVPSHRHGGSPWAVGYPDTTDSGSGYRTRLSLYIKV